MVYSDWLSPGPEQEPRPRHGQMGCMVLRRTFHTAPEQEQGPTPIVPHCSDSDHLPVPDTAGVITPINTHIYVIVCLTCRQGISGSAFTLVSCI